LAAQLGLQIAETARHGVVVVSCVVGVCGGRDEAGVDELLEEAFVEGSVVGARWGGRRISRRRRGRKLRRGDGREGSSR